MIAPGPRTEARRAHAADMKRAWEMLTPEARDILMEFARAERQRIVRAVADEMPPGSTSGEP